LINDLKSPPRDLFFKQTLPPAIKAAQSGPGQKFGGKAGARLCSLNLGGKWVNTRFRSVSGWWFGTCFISIDWECHHPN